MKLSTVLFGFAAYYLYQAMKLKQAETAAKNARAAQSRTGVSGYNTPYPYAYAYPYGANNLSGLGAVVSQEVPNTDGFLDVYDTVNKDEIDSYNAYQPLDVDVKHTAIPTAVASQYAQFMPNSRYSPKPGVPAIKADFRAGMVQTPWNEQEKIQNHLVSAESWRHQIVNLG